MFKKVGCLILLFIVGTIIFSFTQPGYSFDFTNDPNADYNEALKEYNDALGRFKLAKWDLEMYYNGVRNGREKANSLTEMALSGLVESSRQDLETAEINLETAQSRLNNNTQNQQSVQYQQPQQEQQSQQTTTKSSAFPVPFGLTGLCVGFLYGTINPSDPSNPIRSGLAYGFGFGLLGLGIDAIMHISGAYGYYSDDDNKNNLSINFNQNNNSVYLAYNKPEYELFYMNFVAYSF